MSEEIKEIKEVKEVKEKKRLKNIGKRLLFVAWATPLALFIVNSQVNIIPMIFGDKFNEIIKPVYPSTILGFLLIALAAKEYFSMLKIKFPKNCFWVGYIWIFVTMCGEIIYEPLLGLSHSLYILLILTAFESFIFGKGKQWKRASLFFVGVVFLYLAGSYLLKYLEPAFMGIWNFPVDNKYFAANFGLVTVLCAIFLCDSGAYFVGSLFGKHHFSEISPKKTIEGCVGGFLFSVAIMTIVFGFFGNHPEKPVWLGVLLGVAIGIFAQVGDLFVSLTKRYFAVKDSSDLIPGHGGILDRFDSVFFASPFVHIIITLVNKLS
ncbi:MAG: phosphatidate cytidylyltransferase [Chitinivibrionia bacterium]|nr:phosphatidate cytidylyltransferase [Chitinivibrionia bacterium]